MTEQSPSYEIPIGTRVLDYNGQPLGVVHEVHAHYLLVGQPGVHTDLDIPVHAITDFSNGVVRVSITKSSATEVDDQESAHNVIEGQHPSHE